MKFHTPFRNHFKHSHIENNNIRVKSKANKHSSKMSLILMECPQCAGQMKIDKQNIWTCEDCGCEIHNDYILINEGDVIICENFGYEDDTIDIGCKNIEWR